MTWTERVKRLLWPPDPIPWVEGVHFIPADASAYGVDLWDCAEYTQSRLTGSSDPNVAVRFVRLRTSAGDEYRDQLPLNASVVTCALQYAVSQEFPDGPLFKAGEMEDKWDVYAFSPCIYFTRSWGGDLMFRATAHVDQARLTITRIEAAEGYEPEIARRVVDYLVKSHLLGAVVPHPLPPDLPRDPTQIAAYSFAMYGRRCSLGTHADTTLMSAPLALADRQVI